MSERIDGVQLALNGNTAGSVVAEICGRAEGFQPLDAAVDGVSHSADPTRGSGLEAPSSGLHVSPAGLVREMACNPGDTPLGAGAMPGARRDCGDAQQREPDFSEEVDPSPGAEPPVPHTELHTGYPVSEPKHRVPEYPTEVCRDTLADIPSNSAAGLLTDRASASEGEVLESMEQEALETIPVTADQPENEGGGVNGEAEAPGETQRVEDPQSEIEEEEGEEEEEVDDVVEEVLPDNNFQGTSPNPSTQSPGEMPPSGERQKSNSCQSHSKYNTVSYRKIRKGNTKQRIDEFESMMHT